MGVQMEPYPELSDSFWRDCLKSLASLKTNASKPTKQSEEGSFRCDMTAISALETLLSDFLDKFQKGNSAKFACRIVHRTPSKSYEDGLRGHSRREGGDYMLWWCIKIRGYE